MTALGDLLPELSAEIAVTGLTADSRAVRPGFVFFAVPGTKADGLAFAPAAIAAGAVAIVAEREPEAPLPGAVFVRVPDVRAASFRAAAHRQSLAVAASAHARDDQAFIDDASDWGEE